MAGATPAAVAGVYAQALLELADERGKRAAIVDDCRALIEALAEKPQMLAGLDDPSVGKARAKEILAKAFAALQPESLDLLRVLVDRNRIGDLAAIVREAVARADAAAGVVHVYATSAAELSPAARARLEGRLKTVYGPGVVIHPAIDPSLIGGVTVRVGDQYADASVRRLLNEMKNVILNAPVDQRLWEGVSA